MGDNPYLARKLREATKGHGLKAEAKTAKRLGGNLRPGSGAIDGLKGDFSVDGFLFENKSTINKSLSIKLDWLNKITKEAMAEGQTPALAIQFVDADGEPLIGGSWVMIPESHVRGY